MPGTVQELRVSNDALRDGAELRRRRDEDGYLFFRGILNRDRLLELRRDITRVLHAAGWLAAGSDSLAGIADTAHRCTEGDPGYSPVYFQVQRLESFHRLPHDRELMDVVEAIMGGKAIPLPGNKARIWFPRFGEHTTPMHQDFVHYQGGVSILTCWAPVGDCPIELGPLAVLPGSHKVRKVLPHHFSLGAGGLIIDLEEQRAKYPQLARPWVSTDFQLGDVLFFPALTVHKALPNLTEDRMRISLDNRYQLVGDRIAEHMLLPHLAEGTSFTWEEVYRDWKSNDLKYYWTRVPFRKTARYWGYARRGFEEAKELARRGDRRAILAMRRAIWASPSSEDARAARLILQEIGVPEQETARAGA
jgi:ectoine hydroxylase-related dioxygenase (phytanoyl-CoA dioxygenase family)